jgi:hypothetical protein
VSRFKDNVILVVANGARSGGMRQASYLAKNRRPIDGRLRTSSANAEALSSTAVRAEDRLGLRGASLAFGVVSDDVSRRQQQITSL